MTTVWGAGRAPAPHPSSNSPASALTAPIGSGWLFGIRRLRGAAKAVMRMADHRHYVQGVAWDPAGQFLVTQSGDRTCRVYSPVLPTATGKKGKPAVKPEDWGRYLTCMVRPRLASLQALQPTPDAWFLYGDAMLNLRRASDSTNRRRGQKHSWLQRRAVQSLARWR